MPQLHGAPVVHALLLRPAGESIEHRLVGLLRVLGLPALVAEVLKKVFDQLVHQNFRPVKRS